MKLTINTSALWCEKISIGPEGITISPSQFPCTVDWKGTITWPGIALSSVLNFCGTVGWIGLKEAPYEDYPQE